MSELIELYGSQLTQEESDKQDEFTIKLLQNTGKAILIISSFILVLPIISNAHDKIHTLKDINGLKDIHDIGSHGFKTIDYRPKKAIKKAIKKTIKKTLENSSIKNVSIEVSPFGVIDLNNIIKKLFSNNQNSIAISELVDKKPEIANKLLNKVMNTIAKTKHSVLKNRVTILTGISGGFFGIGAGELHVAKKVFDFTKNMLSKEEEKKKEREKNKEAMNFGPLLGTLGGVVGTATSPYILAPILITILLRGKIHGPKNAKEFDQLPEPLKPLFKKPSKGKRFIDYYIRPIYNFNTPLPYFIIGGTITYFYKGKLIAFITNKDEYRSSFGEIASIMMRQVKHQFSEFVTFVKNNNIIIIEELRRAGEQYNNLVKNDKKEDKETIQEQKSTIKEKETELQVCNSNKGKLERGYAECSIKYNYARENFQQHLFENQLPMSTSKDEKYSLDRITQSIKEHTQRVLPALVQDVTQLEKDSLLALPSLPGTNNQKKK